MSELAGLEAAAAPVVEAAIKALEPEAAAFLDAFTQHAEAEGTKLKAAVEQLLTEHHTGLLGWIQDHLVTLPGNGQGSGGAVDPTSAAPAPQA